MSSRRGRSHVAALLVIVMLPALAPAAAGAAPVGDCRADSSWAAPLPDPAARVADLVNRHRASKGLAQLAVSPTLSAGAVWKARHMATYGYMEHNDPAPPVNRSFDQRLQACGYPVAAPVGENIATGQGTPESVMTGWLNSQGHRENVERPSFRAIGVGVARGGNGRLYWAQDFGSVVDAGAAVPQPPAPAPPPRAGPGAAPSATAPAAPAAGSAAAVRVRGCRRSAHRRRRASCGLVLPAAPATVRGRLLRGRKAVARGVLHAGSAGSARIRLKGRRALRPGRRVLRLRIGDTVARRTVRLR